MSTYSKMPADQQEGTERTEIFNVFLCCLCLLLLDISSRKNQSANTVGDFHFVEIDQ